MYPDEYNVIQSPLYYESSYWLDKIVKLPCKTKVNHVQLYNAVSLGSSIFDTITV